MREFCRRTFILYLPLATGLIALPQLGFAQQADGPQTAAPPPVATAQPAAKQAPASSEFIRIPAGTHVAVVLENGISTGSAKAGDSVYFHTSFPITQNNHIIIPCWFVSSRGADRIQTAGQGQRARRISHALGYADFS